MTWSTSVAFTIKPWAEHVLQSGSHERTKARSFFQAALS
jgi:hypothetical protein